MATTKPFHLPETTLKTVRTGYLYANGKLVLCHETRHAKAGKVEWVTLHDTPIFCVRRADRAASFRRRAADASGDPRQGDSRLR
jgi:hypothetical protein